MMDRVGGMDTDSMAFLIRKLVQDEMVLFQREMQDELAQVKADVARLELSIDSRFQDLERRMRSEGRQAPASLQDLLTAPTPPGGLRMSSALKGGTGGPLFKSGSSLQQRDLQESDRVLSEHQASVMGLLEACIDSSENAVEKQFSLEHRLTSLEGRLGEHGPHLEERVRHMELSLSGELALLKNGMADQQSMQHSDRGGIAARHSSLTDEVDALRSALSGAQSRIREVFDKSAVAAQEILIISDGQNMLKRSVEDKIARMDESVRANTMSISMQEDTVRSTNVKIKHIEEFLSQFRRGPSATTM